MEKEFPVETLMERCDAGDMDVSVDVHRARRVIDSPHFPASYKLIIKLLNGSWILCLAFGIIGIIAYSRWAILFIAAGVLCAYLCHRGEAACVRRYALSDSKVLDDLIQEGIIDINAAK